MVKRKPTTIRLDEADDEAIVTDLLPLMGCVDGQVNQPFSDCIVDHIELDEWLAEIALDNVLPDVDGMANAGQNFMLYRDPDSTHFIVYPWDKDLALSTNNAVEGDAAGISQVLSTWRTDFESALVTRLLESYQQSYCQAVLDVAQRYDPDVFLPEIEDLRSFLAPYMEQDPFIDAERWGWMVDDVVEVVETRHPYVVELAQACGG